MIGYYYQLPQNHPSNLTPNWVENLRTLIKLHGNYAGEKRDELKERIPIHPVISYFTVEVTMKMVN